MNALQEESRMARTRCGRPEHDSRRTARGLLAACPLLLLALSTGCSTCKDWFAQYRDGEPPVGVACKTEMRWDKNLYEAHDTVHGGTTVVGYAGVVYLYASAQEDGPPICGDGDIDVSIFDDTIPPQAGKQPVPVETVHFDKETLKKLVRKDVIGYGYRLFLPAEHPEIASVRLEICYRPTQGSPLYSQDSHLSLDSQSLQIVAHRYIPGQPAQMVAGQQPASTPPVAGTTVPNPMPPNLAAATMVPPAPPYAPPQNLPPGVQFAPGQVLPTAVQYGPTGGPNQGQALPNGAPQGIVPTSMNQYAPLQNQNQEPTGRYVIVPGSFGQPAAQIGGGGR